MIPYGKDNWRRNADTARGEWFAARGYALCRVDVRGTGSSGGRRARRVHRRRDARRVRRRRVAGRPAVVHRRRRDVGHLYGGFTAIQVAKLRPPHLRAIVPVQATDDRYLDDVHYIGGCVTASELSQYAVSQVAMNAMPPDAAFRGDGVAGRVARAARGDAAVAVRVAAPADRRPVLAAGLARARLRRDRGGDPQHRRLVRRLRRPGVPDAGALHRADADAGRQLGPRLAAGLAARAEPRRAPRDRCGSSTASCAASANGFDDEPAVVWFERDYAEPEAFPEAWPGRWRAADAYPAPGDHDPAVPVRGRRRCRSAGRLVERGSGRARASTRYRHRADGRDARVACRGAPAGSRTGWRATSGRTRRWARPSRALP